MYITTNNNFVIPYSKYLIYRSYLILTKSLWKVSSLNLIDEEIEVLEDEVSFLWLWILELEFKLRQC